MRTRPLLCLILCGLILVASSPAQTAGKRPLTHADYAAWRSIQSPALSPNGAYVAYALAPQEGDGDFVLVDLRTGKEARHPRGSRATVNVPARARGKGKAALGASLHAFTADSKYVLFPAYATKADREKKKGLTAATLCLLEIAPNKLTRIDNVRNFQVNPEGPAFVAYLRDARPVPPDSSKGTPAVTARPGKRGPATGPVTGELVLRNIADGSERTFSDVSEYTLARDGKALVYVVSATKKVAPAGVFAVTPGLTAPPVVVRSGPGKYSPLTWDEKQTQLAFLHTPPPTGETKLPPRIVHWKRSAPAPVLPMTPFTSVAAAMPAGVELTPAGKAAIRDGWRVSEAGELGWSLDGTRLYFGVAPPPPPKAADRPAVELWHYQDDFIQPMQKAGYEKAQARTYRAVFDLADRSCRQLADDTMPTVSVAPEGDLAVGADDRPYRRLIGGSEVTAFSDLYMVNTKSGERRPLLKKQNGASWSPGGKYLLRWDGKDWHCHAVATGKSVNLTARLGPLFADEQHDAPSTRPPYGIAGWTPGDAAVLVYDRYDLWLIRPDASDATNVTAGVGRKNTTQLRLVTLDPKQRHIDPARPVLLRAENLETRDSGFYRLSFKEGPKLLIMGARSYNVVAKAKDSERYLLNISTFHDYPDLYTADADFREVRRVSDANPQKKDFVWGKAELVRYRSADGVPLTGVLVRPDNFDPKKKYPMMVYIYERLSQNLHRFVDPRPGTSINPSYYASNGYLVLMPDIAYTVGYPGQSAVKCVLPAVEKVIDQGCVDEKAIGIQGHSWGGYQTAYLITQTNRFKAASAGAPVTNMTSAYGGIRWGTGLPRQFQYEKTQSRIGGSLWQYPTRFVENSPLFMADRVRTPLLMLHNDRDEAVPWQEGIQYYLALRRLEKEAYLFNYTGEGHGLAQRKNQQDYTVRLQQFFDHHLKGAAKPAWMAKGEAFAPPPRAGTATEGE